MKRRDGQTNGWVDAGMDAGAGSLCKRLAFTGSTAVEKMVQTRHSLIKGECSTSFLQEWQKSETTDAHRSDAMSNIA